MSAHHRRDIEVVADATTLEKVKKRVTAGQPGYGEFTFDADEGAYMPGGEGSAPTPLTYFVSGVALCLLSHVTEIAAKVKVTLEDPRVSVRASFHEEGSVLRGDKTGACDGFEITVNAGCEDHRRAEEIVHMAQSVCFALDALTRAIPLSVQTDIRAPGDDSRSP